MKNNGLLFFLGCCVLAVAIIVTGNIVAKELPETTKVPSVVYIQTDEEVKCGDYLSVSEAADYLRLEYDELWDLIKLGDLDAAICQWTDEGNIDHIIISKKALQEWAENKVVEE